MDNSWIEHLTPINSNAFAESWSEICCINTHHARLIDVSACIRIFANIKFNDSWLADNRHQIVDKESRYATYRRCSSPEGWGRIGAHKCSLIRIIGMEARITVGQRV
jgi:hypothetical protein